MALRFLQLACRFHEVFLDTIVSIRTDSKHTSLCRYIAQVCSVEAIRQLYNSFVVQLIPLGNGARVNFENLQTTLFIRERNLDLAVNAPRSEQRRIQRVWPVRRHNDFCLSELIKSIHLIQQLHQCSLDFSVCACSLAESTPTNGIDFVHKDNTWLFRLGIGEHFTDETCTFTNVLVNNRASHNL